MAKALVQTSFPVRDLNEITCRLKPDNATDTTGMTLATLLLVSEIHCPGGRNVSTTQATVQLSLIHI